jgi:hypothetical protein
MGFYFQHSIISPDAKSLEILKRMGLRLAAKYKKRRPENPAAH